MTIAVHLALSYITIIRVVGQRCHRAAGLPLAEPLATSSPIIHVLYVVVGRHVFLMLTNNSNQYSAIIKGAPLRAAPHGRIRSRPVVEL